MTPHLIEVKKQLLYKSLLLLVITSLFIRDQNPADIHVIKRTSIFSELLCKLPKKALTWYFLRPYGVKSHWLLSVSICILLLCIPHCVLTVHMSY